MEIKGTYKIKTELENAPEIAFLHTKLSEEEKVYTDYTSPFRSWRRYSPLSDDSELPLGSQYCIECPDNTGNYGSLADCIEGKYKAGMGDVGGFNITSDDSRKITMYFSIGLRPGYEILPRKFAIPGYSYSFPVGVSIDPGDINLDGYGIWYGVADSAGSCVLGSCVPPNFAGTVGYFLNSKVWHGSDWTKVKDRLSCRIKNQDGNETRFDINDGEGFWNQDYSSNDFYNGTVYRLMSTMTGTFETKLAPSQCGDILPFDQIGIPILWNKRRYRWENKNPAYDYSIFENCQVTEGSNTITGSFNISLFTVGETTITAWGLPTDYSDQGYRPGNAVVTAITPTSVTFAGDPALYSIKSKVYLNYVYDAFHYYDEDNEYTEATLSDSDGTEYELIENNSLSFDFNHLNDDKGLSIGIKTDYRNKALCDDWLERIKAYFELEGEIVYHGALGPLGCSSVLDGEGNPVIELPDPPIVVGASAKGRKTEVWLNYQKSANEVLEIKIPLEFSQLLTKLSFPDTRYYDSRMPVVGGYTPYRHPVISEVFIGRVEVMDDKIIVVISHSPTKKWELGRVIQVEQEEIGEWMSLRLQEYTNAIGEAPVHAQYTADPKNAAKPEKDIFNKIAVFVYDKNGELTETKNYNYPALPVAASDCWFYDMIKDYYLIDYRDLGLWDTDFRLTFDDVPAANISYVLPQRSDMKNYFGNPYPFFQTVFLDTILADWNDTGVLLSDIHQHLKDPNLWTELDWIFYYLAEEPTLDFSVLPDSRIFRQNYLFGGHGKYNPAYKAIGGNLISNLKCADYFYDCGKATFRVNYLDEIVEVERLVGTGIKKDGNILKWLRISEKSLPFFEPNFIVGAEGL
jgi:hypothetical protein